MCVNSDKEDVGREEDESMSEWLKHCSFLSFPFSPSLFVLELDPL